MPDKPIGQGSESGSGLDTQSGADEVAVTPDPPYYAVIFTSIQTESLEGYAETAEEMLKLAARQSGFLGVESARSGLGITVSYWRDLDSINSWKIDARHLAAKQQGLAQWYERCVTRIALVEKSYGRITNR